MRDPRETLTRIRKQTDAATPGPWKSLDLPVIVRGYSKTIHSPAGTGRTWTVDIGPEIASTVSDEDAEFIAAARTDVPWLLDQVELRDKALEAALNEHPTGVFHSFTGDIPWCDACDAPYPCPTVAAITTALEGLHHA